MCFCEKNVTQSTNCSQSVSFLSTLAAKMLTTFGVMKVAARLNCSWRCEVKPKNWDTESCFQSSYANLSRLTTASTVSQILVKCSVKTISPGLKSWHFVVTLNHLTNLTRPKNHQIIKCHWNRFHHSYCKYLNATHY